MAGKQRNGLILFFLLVFMGSACMTIMQVKEYRQSEKARNRAEELAKLEGAEFQTTELPISEIHKITDMELAKYPKEPLYTDSVTDAMNAMDLETLQMENEDIVGWILIPDTEISYPFLQGEDNAYYLEHTWEHKQSKGGSIVLEQMCSRALTDDHTIIYGHRMKNRSMFGSLAFYQEKEYLEHHPYIYLKDSQGCRVYEIYAVYEAKTDDPVYQVGTFDEEMKKEWIEWTVQKSVVDTGIVPEPDSRILTLSTCTAANSWEKRWIVQGVFKGMSPVVMGSLLSGAARS